MIAQPRAWKLIAATRCIVIVVISLLGPSELVHAQDFSVVHAFSTYGDGVPNYLIQASDGNFYGATIAGGQGGMGHRFRMTPDGTITFFESACSTFPLIEGNDGNLYGPGFRVTLDGVCTLFYSFTTYQYSILVAGRDGNFYGMTGLDGAFNHGTIYQMTPDGVVTIMHSFTDAEGGPSLAPLIQGMDGNFYGTTLSGGSHASGTVFKFAADGTFSVLHEFGETPIDAMQPHAPLMQARNGIFYGTTTYGGTFGAGTVFSMTPDGTVTIIHSFSGGADGATPIAPLIQTKDGRIYGISRDTAAIFQVIFGTVVVMHTLDLPTEGFGANGIIQARDGNLYGTAANGGAGSAGTVFRFNIGSPCVNALGLTYDAGALNMQFTLKSSTPGLWSTWLASQGRISALWSVPIPTVSPTVSFDVPIPSFPHIGTVGVLTTLVSSTLDFCADWKTVDTGGVGASRQDLTTLMKSSGLGLP